MSRCRGRGAGHHHCRPHLRRRRSTRRPN